MTPQTAYHEKEQELAHATRTPNSAARAAVHYKKRADLFEAQVLSLQLRIAELERTLAAVQRQAHDNAKLLDIRTTELHAAESFLSSAGDLPESDVLDLVKNINTQIFQISTTIADTYQDRYSADRDDIKSATIWLKKFFGSIDIVGPLRDAVSSPDDAPFFVQIALQGFMVSLVHVICGTWDFTTNSQLQDSLSRLQKSIAAAEPQSVSGRWRALCRSHIRMLMDADTKVVPRAEKEMVEGVSAVLWAFGVHDGAIEELCDLVSAAHTPALRDIVLQALEFRRAAGERVVSCDLEVVLCRCGLQFDDTLMDDEWADPKASRRRKLGNQQVLCTTALGLVRQNEVKGAKDGEEDSGHDNGDGCRRRCTILLKPKVTLSSVLKRA
ncbi:uncharacterized protein BXZ73DRAFT_43017 [Epithele typhae]|uniref:uncharacterized protein n=1 Tax=Epithele typhae TaxID=378194 RepID=UPI00200855CD|nr:uncharacterized protein BXZ73DRAFT_43017 [Epithele typhae]KAH9940101.1 hypothetical protein BXZ73DRAFT_43017 [Epithele typhae]